MTLKILWEKWTPSWDASTQSAINSDDGPSNVALLMTSSGPIPLQDVHPMKQFNFWIAHTNFPISEEIAETIDEINGVEAFNVISPLRMRIAIGKLFNEMQIKMEIGYLVNEFYKSLELVMKNNEGAKDGDT